MSHRDSPRKQTLAVASMCCASGAGLESAVARRNGRFTIEAKDAEGQQLPHGGDTFTVTIHGASVVRARVTDKEDGTYTCEYKTSASGSYTVAILLHGAPIKSSPFNLQVLMPRPDAAQCVARGDALTKAAARETMAFEVSFVDALGNVTYAEELDVYVEPIAQDEDEDDGLERLIGTRAEEHARAWARQWAFLRVSELRHTPLERLKQLVDDEVERMQQKKREEEAAARAAKKALEEEEAAKLAALAPPPPPPEPQSRSRGSQRGQSAQSGQGSKKAEKAVELPPATENAAPPPPPAAEEVTPPPVAAPAPPLPSLPSLLAFTASCAQVLLLSHEA